jgi:septal ring factor EnvC (AmiA/AmiB activator)
MDQKIKYLVVGLGVLLVISLFLNLQSQGKRRAIEQENAELLKTGEILKKKMEDTSKEKQRLQEQLTKVQEEKEDIGKQLEALEKSKKELTAQLKEIRQAFSTKLDELSKKKSELEEQIKKLEEDNSRLKRKVAAGGQNSFESAFKPEPSRFSENYSGGAFSSSQSQSSAIYVNSPSQSVELPPIVVRPFSEEQKTERQDTVQGAPLMGRILSINKENNFVVINAGNNSGVKNGDILHVFRKDEQIAEIEVIQVRSTVSAADIRSQSALIKTGDTVIR